MPVISATGHEQTLAARQPLDLRATSGRGHKRTLAAREPILIFAAFISTPMFVLSPRSPSHHDHSNKHGRQ